MPPRRRAAERAPDGAAEAAPPRRAARKAPAAAPTEPHEDTAAPGVPDTAVTPDGARLVDLDVRTMLLFCAAFVTLLAVAAVVRSAPRTMTALAVGTLLALSLNPLVESAERRFKVGRPYAVGIVFASFAVIVTVLAVILVPPAVKQAQALGEDLPRVVGQLADLPFVGDKLADAGVPDTVLKRVQTLPDRLAGDLSPVAGAARGALSGMGAALVVVLFAVGLLVDGPRLVEHGARLVPGRRRATAQRVGQLMYAAVGRYVAGSITVALIAGLATLVAGLVLQVPLTPLLAANVMVFDLVPQIGGAAGGIPFVVMGFTHSATTGVLCAVFFILYLQFENNILSPLVVGQAVKLSPPATMSAALIGVAAGGVVGALCAVPFVGAMKIVYLEFRGTPVEIDNAKKKVPLLSRLASRFRGRRTPAGSQRQPGD
ncbi:MAG TPA: AI-2E family transporter [Frankiaceae bacterium]|nr:AI-2E family transporter [Frankiaceae bacterium]